MVVAQLVERSLPIPEVRGSNPVIGKNYIEHLFIVYCQLCIEKTKIKKKEAMNGPFLKKCLTPSLQKISQAYVRHFIILYKCK